MQYTRSLLTILIGYLLLGIAFALWVAPWLGFTSIDDAATLVVATVFWPGYLWFYFFAPYLN